MDLKRKTDLTKDENLEVSGDLQVLVLAEISRAEAWKPGDGALHGGGGVRYRHGSERWSEDLDFMVDSGRFDRLEAMSSRVMDAVRRTASMLWPGCELHLKTRTRQDETDALHVWDVRWFHPSRQGKVQVKVEFYRTKRELLESYGSDIVSVVHASGRARVRGQLPMADAISMWGDKIKAVATRPAFKWRDAHDLGYLRGAMERSGGVGDEARLRAIELSASVYGKTLEDLLPLLREKLGSGVLDDQAAFMEDMERWFPSGPAGREAVSMVEGFLVGAKSEVARAVALIEQELEHRSPPPGFGR